MPAPILPSPANERALPRRFTVRWLLVGIAVASAVLFFSTPTRERAWHTIDDWSRPPRPPMESQERPPFYPLSHTEHASHIASDSVWADRALQVKKAFLHAYHGYMEHAYPHDEVKPLFNGSQDNFYGFGVTVVDSLDTMIIMGLEREYEHAVEHVASLRFDLDQEIGFFEPVIRYLGGLISAYALTNNSIFIARADDLGSHMLPAFNTSSGLPATHINLKTGEASFGGWQSENTVCLAELGSCQLEFRALAHYTGRKEYVQAVDRVSEALRQVNPKDGLYPMSYYVEGVRPNGDQAAVGGCGDSTYEYLLKGYLLTNQSESRWHDMYLASARGIIDKLLYISKNRELLYVTDTNHLIPSNKLEHLSCFLPGLLALGVHRLPSLSDEERQRHLWAAEGLGHTCWLTYADQPSGLGPDEVMFQTGMTPARPWIEALGDWKKQGAHGRPPGTGQATPVAQVNQRDYTVWRNGYLLRPETVESFYILWRVTQDEKWRERGWAVFQAIEKYSRTGSGYASLSDVTVSPPTMMDESPSYFLAETLKYLYLLFTDEELIPLDRFVFNTEAHPLPVFDWSPWERKSFGILD